jgi:hypothetical protein
MAAKEKSEAGCATPGATAMLGGPDCACRAAVIRAFDGMTMSGASWESAIAVAHRVFQHHHPDVTSGAGALIERWLSDEILH